MVPDLPFTGRSVGALIGLGVALSGCSACSSKETPPPPSEPRPGAYDVNGRLPAYPEARLEDALILAARDAVPAEMPLSEIIRALEWGVWDADHTAFAVSIERPRATVVLVFLRQANGAFRAVDVSAVERGNLGKLGFPGGSFERVETTPLEASRRRDGSLEVVVRTRAWKAGQRHTVSEPVLIGPDGAVLWR